MLPFNQKSIVGKVYRDIKKSRLIEEGDHIVVAVSGGADSIALLDILMNLRSQLHISLSACHFNHLLRGEASEEDESFVEEFCRKNGIECEVGRAKAKNLYKSENSAREARYTFFEKISEQGRGKIALAHQKNDLAETLLMRIIRGSGSRGLSSIPASRGNFIRPLLSVSRSEIESYLEERHLAYRTDQSNFDLDFLRNRIRHEVIPMLEKINPNILETLATEAVQFQDDSALLDKVIAQKLDHLILESSTDSVSLDYAKWLKLDIALKRVVLREAIASFDNLLDITFKQIAEATDLLEKGINKKFKLLPHSLRIELKNAKIIIRKEN